MTPLQWLQKSRFALTEPAEVAMPMSSDHPHSATGRRLFGRQPCGWLG